MSNEALEHQLYILQQEYEKKFLFYTPHPKQLKFHELGFNARVRLFLAANRIGKTYSASMECCFHATGVYPKWWVGRRFSFPVLVWVAAPTFECGRQILKRYMSKDGDTPSYLHKDYIVSYHKVDKVLTVRHISGGISSIHFKAYDQGADKFAGDKVQVIHADEPMPFDVYSECSTRLTKTGINEPQGIMLYTATMVIDQKKSGVRVQDMRALIEMFTESVEKTTKEVNGITFEEKEVSSIPSETVHKNRAYIVAGLADAAHLPDEEKEAMRSGWRPEEIQVRSTGIPKWGSGLVYPVDEDFFVVPPFEIPDHWQYVCGLDFGWRNTALVVLAVDRDTNMTYVIAEYKEAERSPSQHVGEWSRRRNLAPHKTAPIMADPAGLQRSQADGRKLFDLFQEEGVRLTKADNSVSAGTMAVLQALQRGRLKVFSTCQETLRERRGYAYQNDGKPKKGDDHLMDALRYAYMGLDGACSALAEEYLEPTVGGWGIV